MLSNRSFWASREFPLLKPDGEGGGGEGSGSEGGTGGAGSGAGESHEDVAGLKSALKQERDARKAADKTLKELNDKIAALEAKDKTDVERLTGERDKLKADLDARETRLREMAVRTALTSAATNAGARYPDLLVDRLGKDADVDDELNVTNAEKLVTDAKKSYPDLFRVVDGKADGGKGDEGKGADIKPGFMRLANAYATESKTATTR